MLLIIFLFKIGSRVTTTTNTKEQENKEKKKSTATTDRSCPATSWGSSKQSL
jgi:hypothetical protein